MMKIQSLAVIAIIILLPMTLILSSYISSQAKTLSYQVEYDAKLQNSTYDALKAFQMNTANSDTSDIANSKIRDVKAGANSFFNSLANNFNMPGYDKEALSQFVPAVVFTMYDGYYIYAPYENTLDKNNKNFDSLGVDLGSDAEVLSDKASSKDIRYKDGDDLTGLKPYVYYSARYQTDGGADVTITYALDNYIVIHGKKSDGTAIDISGYLLTNVKEIPNTEKPEDEKVMYRGVTIEVEGKNNDTLIKERTFISKQADTDNGSPAISVRALVPCRMINGVRYYNLGTAFSEKYTNNAGREVLPQGIWALLNGSWRQQNYASTTEIKREELELSKVRAQDVRYNSNAVEYYKDAFEFKTEIENAGLKGLKVGNMMIDCTDDDGHHITKPYDELSDDEKQNISYLGDPTSAIFKGLDSATDGIDIEEPESNFNEHRLGIIRYAIEKNLSNAINNFNTYSTSSTEFQMPKLSEEEWTYIYDNLCVITFMQGLSIGGKIYNGHAVVPNTDNKEVVTEDSIYIVGNDNKIYKATYNFENKEEDVFSGINSSVARWKMDFKRASTEDVNNGTIEYFYRYPEDSNLKNDAQPKTLDFFKNNPTELINNKYCLVYTWNSENVMLGVKPEAWYAYDSIVDTSGNHVLGSKEVQVGGTEIEIDDNMYDYMEKMYNSVEPSKKALAKAYFTALARARWGMYRVENPVFETAYPDDME